VIYGTSEAEPIPGQPYRLTDARMILRWRGRRGLFDLAASGPREGTRITTAEAWTSGEAVRQVLPVSDAAAAAIDAWPDAS
jgi:hypothetical protein